MINHAELTALAKIADGIAANPPSNDERHHDWQMGYQDGAMAVAAAIDEFSPSVIGSDTCLLDGALEAAIRKLWPLGFGPKNLDELVTFVETERECDREYREAIAALGTQQEPAAGTEGQKPGNRATQGTPVDRQLGETGPSLASPSPFPVVQSEAIAGLLVRLDRGAMGSGVGPLDCREAAAALRALPAHSKAGSE